MVSSIPSNIPVLSEGKITVTVFRDALWHDEPLPRTADPKASALRYCQLWIAEFAKRWPRTQIEIVSKPGDNPALVSVTDNHPDQDGVMKDVLRLGMEVYGRRNEWLIYSGTRESKRLREKYPAPKEEAAPNV